jgi:hypothetical protein
MTGVIVSCCGIPDLDGIYIVSKSLQSTYLNDENRLVFLCAENHCQATETFSLVRTRKVVPFTNKVYFLWQFIANTKDKEIDRNYKVNGKVLYYCCTQNENSLPPLTDWRASSAFGVLPVPSLRVANQTDLDHLSYKKENSMGIITASSMKSDSFKLCTMKRNDYLSQEIAPKRRKNRGNKLSFESTAIERINSSSSNNIIIVDRNINESLKKSFNFENEIFCQFSSFEKRVCSLNTADSSDFSTGTTTFAATTDSSSSSTGTGSSSAHSSYQSRMDLLRRHVRS